MGTPHKSIRVFENPILERFTHLHPLTPLVLWTPIIAWLLWHSVRVLEFGWLELLGFAVAGLFTWTLTEYLVHRFIFHMKTGTAFRKRLQFLMHGLHHADPTDPTRLVMPPMAAMILAGVLFLFFRTVLGGQAVQPFFAFFLIGYLCYDYIHCAIHSLNPRFSIGKSLKRHHMLHHYVNAASRWGVSSPLWDHVFDTLD